MDLFENLQNIKNESSVLVERDELSVSEYNKLKIALNRHNSMKANFILHPGKSATIDYKMKLSVFGAFKNKEHSRDSHYVYSSDYKNDEITRDGVGVHLYTAYINLIDESITYVDAHEYIIERYIKDYESYLLQNDIIRNNEMDVKNLTQAIINTANASKTDLEQCLHSKNFIYNLTGKRKVKSQDSDEYNLNLENSKLTEDFDPSMPNWLMRAIKLNNNSRNRGHKDINYNVPFDTMKWTVEPFPEKGKLDNVGSNEYIALLIDKSGDRLEGQYTVYFPAAYIGNDETIEINGRNRRIDSMSLRALAPYVKEYAHTIGSSDSKKDVHQKQLNRQDARNGSIDRINSNNAYSYPYGYDNIDKSGYIVDPNKYKRLLAQMKSSQYAERLEEVYVVLSDLKTKLKNYASQDEIIPDAKDNRYSPRNISVEKFAKAYEQYKEAIRYYQWATDELENISKGTKNTWGVEASEKFNNHLSTAEVRIVNCLSLIEPQN